MPVSTSIEKYSRQSNRKRPDPPATKVFAKASAIISPNSNDVTTTTAFGMDDDELDIKNQPWRQYGLQRRQYLLENDKAATSFRMNAACSVQKYFALSERVSPSSCVHFRISHSVN